jgi:hypothetical protein
LKYLGRYARNGAATLKTATTLQQGDIVKAREMFEFSLQRFHKEENVIGVVFTIEGIASLHLNQGQPERATCLISWTDFLREKIGNRRPPIEQEVVNQIITTCLEKLGKAVFSESYEEGKKMSLEAAITKALASI